MRAEILMRPEIADADQNAEIELNRTAWEKIWARDAVRKGAILIALAIVWELYGRYLNNPLLFPTLSETLGSLWRGIETGVIPSRTFASLKVLVLGYSTGVLLAAALSILAINTRLGSDFLETLTATFNPLPAIALLPLALIWFGLGIGSLIFVIVHSVLWAVALNTHTGFRSVSMTLRMVGHNCGLKGIRYVFKILIPAAFPTILTGLKIGWAFAWRTLIAAELVFGVSSGQGGLGWYIFENRNLLDIPAVFAGLLTVILVGLVVENVIFRNIEKNTVKKWGMQN